jgi:hypothetical protein
MRLLAQDRERSRAIVQNVTQKSGLSVARKVVRQSEVRKKVEANRVERKKMGNVVLNRLHLGSGECSSLTLVALSVLL